MKVAVLNVATGGYVELAENLHKSLNENFMTDHEVDIFLFTDSDKDLSHHRCITLTIVEEFKEVAQSFT